MSKKFDFDTIVIWAWSGWLTVSIWLASAGKKVALIEKWLIWWDCTNTGCVPSKAFIDIAKKNYEKKENKNISEILSQVRDTRQIIVDEETPQKIEQHWMKVIQWYGKIIWKNSVEINNNTITAKNIILSTWSHAKIIEIDGLRSSQLLTNENIFEQTDNIKDIVIMWWGYIWCELAEAFANSWVNVSIIQRNKVLIPHEEIESSELIQKEFEQKWIKIYLNTIIKKVEWNKLILENRENKSIQKLEFDKILQSLWRQANVSNLWLKENNIEFSDKWIKTDKYNRTSIKNIFAIWDCVENSPMFTHWANNQWRWVIRNIIFPYIKSSTKKAVLPSTLYTNIEIARVWKTQQELLQHYNSQDIVTKIMYFSQNDRSILTNDTKWFIKIHFKRISGKILWATIAGSHAWEMLPVLTSAMQNNTSAYKLAKIVYAYPTKAEIIKKICDQFVISTLWNIRNEIKYYFKDNILQIITAWIWITIIYSYFYYKSVNNLTNLDLAQWIYNFVSSTFWWPIIYILLYTFRPIIFFPATLMTFMSWALFWVWWGFLFTMIWENLSANFAYLLGKVFWKKLIKPESTGMISDLKEKVSENAFISILMTRLLFFPFDLVNYVSGILKVKWKGFLFGTLIWIIPWALIVVIAWASVENAQEFDLSQISFNMNMIFVSIWLLIVSLWVAKYLKKKWF